LDLTVGIINWNTRNLLEECLNSIFEVESSNSFNVVVVDNDSTDGSPEMVKEKFPQVTLKENSRNVGYAVAANQIIKQSNTPYLFLLNSDTKLVSASFEEMVGFMNMHPSVGVVGPLVLNSDGTIQYSCRNFPSFIDATIHAFLGMLVPSNPYSGRYKMMECNRQSEQKVDWVSGAAMFLRKKAIESIKGFDEGYYMYVEDMDLCYRLQLSGWDAYYLPQVEIYHHIGQSSQQRSTKMIIEHQKSIYRFYSKLYENKPWHYLQFLIAIGLFFRAILLILFNKLKGKKLKAVNK